MFTIAVVLFAQPAWAYLGSFEAQDGYTDGGQVPFQDVTTYNAGEYGTNANGPGGSATNITPNDGLFVKYDQGNVSSGYGELVAHHALAHSGSAGLVLRSNAGFGDTGGDGADYLYSFDKRDFGGVSPTLVTSGTISLDYWMCPQTSFFQTGTVTSTAFVNSAGNTVFAVGTVGQGIFDAKPYIEWEDANGWHVTSILGNNVSWDHIMLSFDLSSDTVSFSYYSSITGITSVLASGVAAAAPIDNLSGIHFTAQANTEKNSYDDFNIISPIVVPEPSSLVAVLVAGVSVCWKRRRR
ncbi:MAG: hypothetical protein JWO94_2228 [Verrucomicrobiaceae bacterium]|nr:hypothetical protein [Verrucomicrobiaceae bacterium]